MSTRYHIKCTECDDVGPGLQRTAGGVSLTMYSGSIPGAADVSEQWALFLIHHDVCAMSGSLILEWEG
jgi:hypothetical protein